MNISFKEEYKNRGWHNFEENLSQPRHRWYPFKEGFSNQLVTEAIRQSTRLKKKTIRVLDPFGGSGTTPLAAALNGHDSITFEVNPFCAFTAKVKCLPGKWNEKSFRNIVKKVLTKSRLRDTPSPLEIVSTFTDGDDRSKWLFNRPVLRAFQSMWDVIEESADGYAAPLKLAAIRSAMNCCNAKKDGKCLRYYEDWKETNYKQQDFYFNFSSFVNRMLRDIDIAPIRRDRKVEILRGDARLKLCEVEDASCDLFVTSPPYLNSFDYSDIYRPELFLGQFVKSNEELRTIRLETVRSHVQVDWGGETATDNPMVSVAVSALRKGGILWNKKIPTMVEAYFYDMRRVIAEAARILKPGAEAWIVVSTSAYNGIQIPVDLILADLGCAQGFTLNGIYVLRALRAAGQQQSSFKHNGLPLRESLIILKR